MCGISGVYNFNEKKVEPVYLKKISREIKHRGPDSEGVFLYKNVGLAHRRLSIIDLSHRGEQPMSTGEGRYHIVFNGEIYNYKELKEKLLLQGHEFFSETDTEVILKLYVQYGKKMLSLLRGMFAFCIYDKFENEFFLVRDRYGIKPVYYYFDDEKLVFCSEIKGILTDDRIQRIANEKVIFDFLVYNRTDHLEETCFSGIFNLRPGHYLSINQNGVKKHKWYKHPIGQEEFAEDESVSIFRKDLEESVKLHMISDVEVGSCLSGGLDSSTIVSLASNLSNKKTLFKTVSAVYGPEWDKDETKYIDDVTKYTKTKNIKVRPTSLDLVQEMDKLIYHQEEPFKSSSIFASWKVMETAKENGIKVLLDGQGADELLGYDYMAAFYFYELLTHLDIYSFFRETVSFVLKQKFGVVFTMSLFFFLLLPKFCRRKLLDKKNEWIDENYRSKYKEGSILFTEFFSAKTLNESVKLHFLYKLNHLLRFEDKNSMAFSIESRVPFLDHVLVEDLFKIPSKMKIRNGILKYILKVSMMDFLPESVIKRTNKIGFETPEDKWFNTKEVQNMFQQVFSSEAFKNRRFYNHKVLDEYFLELHNGGGKYNEILWKVVCLEYWFKVFKVNNI